MPIVKAAARRVDGAEVLARERAAALLAEAGSRAREIAREAERAAAALRERALDETREAIAAERARLAVAAAVERERWLASAEGELARLALEIARRVVGAAAERERAVAVEAAARALHAARDRCRVLVRVNPADLHAVRAAADRLAALAPAAAPVGWAPDPAISPGGAVVETEAGRIDASVEAQLEALARALGVAP
jgi:flagellar biosynthesis/type III secretory pathway protein FliH